MRFINKYSSWLILLFIIIHLVLYIFNNRNFFLDKFDADYFGQLYSKSQYIIGELSEGGIGDDGLYAFAGYYYLAKGGDVSSVNFEHPPLGKYLIGLSIVVFNNENVINIVYFALILLITYKIGKMILVNNSLSFLPLLFISFDPLYLDNLIRSLLSLPFSLFFISAVYFFLKGFKYPKFFYISFLFWGAAFSTRFFPAIILIYVVLLICTIVNNKRNIFTFFKASSFIPIIYIISHTSFFIYHPSLIEFFLHKKWLLFWYSGSPIIIGNIIRNIITGFYLGPTGILTKNKEWWIFLPIMVFLALSSFRLNSILKNQRRKKLKETVIYAICALYFIYLIFLTYGVEKFIMPIYPLLAVLAVSHLKSLYSIIVAWKKVKRQSSRAK